MCVLIADPNESIGDCTRVRTAEACVPVKKDRRRTPKLTIVEFTLQKRRDCFWVLLIAQRNAGNAWTTLLSVFPKLAVRLLHQALDALILTSECRGYDMERRPP